MLGGAWVCEKWIVTRIRFNDVMISEVCGVHRVKYGGTMCFIAS